MMAYAPDLAKRVFVSHSSKDHEFGLKLVGDLRQAFGNDEAVWYDAAGGLNPGDFWWRKIMAELRARSIFLVILSPDALESKWVNTEIDLAWSQLLTLGNTLLIPLLYRECVVRSDLQSLQAVSFLTSTSYETAFAQLVAAVRQAPNVSEEPALEPTHVARPQPASIAPRPDSEPELPQASAQIIQALSITGAFPARRLWLNRPKLAVGRGPGNDIIIDDPAVSSTHASLTVHDKTWHVTREPNAQPLYVNGSLSEAADVRPGDQITLGTSILRLDAPELAGAQPPAAPGRRIAPRLAVDCPDYPCHFIAPLHGAALTIGRSPECSITAPSPIVSLQHALLSANDDGGYTISDLQSRNGSALRGQRIQRERLCDGDVVIIGSSAQKQIVTLTYTES
jgi:pSer/pThr/pTyr-binding forkhead associated (FHA) protein